MKSYNIKDIKSHLEKNGYYYIDTEITTEEYLSIANDIGVIIRREAVKLYETPRRVHRPEKIFLHTDQPFVDIISWHCVQEGRQLTANQLLDLKALNHLIPSEYYEVLSKVEIDYPDPDQTKKYTLDAVFELENNHAKAFYIPWYVVEDLDPEVKKVWDNFNNIVNKSLKDNQFEIELKKSQALFIDNKRMLHGREKLNSTCTRHLERLWIKSNLNTGFNIA